MDDDNSLASMFAKQQEACDLNKAREEYNAQLQKGKEIGLEEAASVRNLKLLVSGTLMRPYATTVCGLMRP